MSSMVLLVEPRNRLQFDHHGMRRVSLGSGQKDGKRFVLLTRSRAALKLSGDGNVLNEQYHYQMKGGALAFWACHLDLHLDQSSRPTVHWQENAKEIYNSEHTCDDTQTNVNEQSEAKQDLNDCGAFKSRCHYVPVTLKPHHILINYRKGYRREFSSCAPLIQS
jgi:hypothetical protein